MEDFVVAGAAALIGLAVASGFIYLKRNYEKKLLADFCQKTGLSNLDSSSTGLVNFTGHVNGKKITYRQNIGSNHSKRSCLVTFNGAALAQNVTSETDKRIPLLVVGRRKIGLIDLAGKVNGTELSLGSPDFEKEFVVAGASSSLARALLQEDVIEEFCELSGNLYFDVSIKIGSIEYDDRGRSIDGDYFKQVIAILCLLADHAEAIDK